MSKQTTEDTAFHAMDAAEALRILKSDRESGLRAADAEARLQKYGPNALKKGRKKTLLQRFILQFGDLMVLILLGAAAVSFATSCLQGEADFADTLLILGIVMANALIGTVQEAKAEHALEALRTMSAPHASVLRDGKRAVLTSEALVPGDIVLLKTGDVVPADLRLLESTQLYAEESALTGESVPAAKSAGAVCAEKIGAAERENMLFSGNRRRVRPRCRRRDRHGHGDRNGPDRRDARRGGNAGHAAQGALAQDWQGDRSARRPDLCGDLCDRPDPARQPARDVHDRDQPCGCRDPEGLPAVVTIVLALGVRRMAAKRAIIRHLQAVETLGSCQVILLRQDRRTLTQNRMTVVRLCGRRGTARNGSGGQHARCGGAVHDGGA